MNVNDIYIGYESRMPRRFVPFVRVSTGLILLATAAFAAMFVLGQRPFARSFFDYGNAVNFEGTVLAKPIPFLIIEKRGESGALPVLERIPLVAEGKFGAGPQLNKFDGKRVYLKGTLIQRDGTRMIELVDGSVRKARGEAAKHSGRSVTLGTMTLRGEIIDSKCYLGVMNPGNHKTHRSCAVACIRGGIAPMFLVKDEKGNRSELWLLAEDGSTVNEQVLDYVAEPVELKGKVIRRDDQLFLYFDPGAILRVD